MSQFLGMYQHCCSLAGNFFSKKKNFKTQARTTMNFTYRVRDRVTQMSSLMWVYCRRRHVKSSYLITCWISYLLFGAHSLFSFNLRSNLHWRDKAVLTFPRTHLSMRYKLQCQWDGQNVGLTFSIRCPVFHTTLPTDTHLQHVFSCAKHERCAHKPSF